jgi:hypothetical protein
VVVGRGYVGRRDDYDRNAREEAGRRACLEKHLAAHPRHHPVEKDDAGSDTVREMLERVLTIDSRDGLEPFGLEDTRKRVPQVGVILREEHKPRLGVHERTLGTRIGAGHNSPDMDQDTTLLKRLGGGPHLKESGS